MYELFTDEARKVMAFANQEAHRLNHEYIGTEHILFGLLKAPGALVGSLLTNLEIDPSKLRRDLERIILRGLQRGPIGSASQTPRAKNVIEYALQEWRAQWPTSKAITSVLSTYCWACCASRRAWHHRF